MLLPIRGPHAQFDYSAPRDLIRRAANTIPTASDRISRSIRTDVPLNYDISEVELVQYRLERELRDAQAHIPALEGTLHCVAKVVKPYLPPNGRPSDFRRKQSSLSIGALADRNLLPIEIEHGESNGRR